MNWHRIELTVTVRISVVRSHVFSQNLGSSGFEFGVVYHVCKAEWEDCGTGERAKTKEYYCAYALTILTMLWSAVVMVEALVYLIIKTIVVLSKG